MLRGNQRVLIKGLLKKGFDVNMYLKYNRTLLLVAVQFSHIQLMEELIQAMLTMKDKKGWTALMYTASGTDTKILEVLLKVGIILEEKTE